MNKKEFLAASKPYGLKFLNKGLYEDVVMSLHGIVFDELYSQYGKFSIKDANPIIRPLDSLTKECAQSDYNEGKPFIPILELAKMCDVRVKCFRDFKVETEHFAYGCKSKDNLFWYNSNGAFQYSIVTNTKEHILAIHNQFELFQQLIKWHFYPNMPENEEVVYVTDDFNPYK